MSSLLGKHADLVQNFGAVILLACGVGGCSAPLKMMPTPVIYVGNQIDPFQDMPVDDQMTTVDVYYATNRKPEAEGSGRYTNDVGTGVSFGIASVRFGDEDLSWSELAAASVSATREREIPLYLAGARELGVLSTDGAQASAGASSPLTRGEQDMTDAINAELAESKFKDIVVYIPGFNVDFDEACLVSAELFHFMGRNGAVLAYSWPSRQSVALYAADAVRARESAGDLADLLQFLADHTDVENINILSYSAGGPLMAHALATLRLRHPDKDEAALREELRIGRVIFAASDVDLTVFDERELNAIDEVSRSIVITVSKSDFALGLTQLNPFSSPRLGMTDVDSLSREELDELAGSPKLDVIDVSAEGAHQAQGHGYWYADPWVSTDIIASLRFHLPPDQRGLVLIEGKQVWCFPPDYPHRIVQLVQEGRSAHTPE